MTPLYFLNNPDGRNLPLLPIILFAPLWTNFFKKYFENVDVIVLLSLLNPMDLSYHTNIVGCDYLSDPEIH